MSRSASDIADEAINKIDQEEAGGGKPADDKPAPKDEKPADKPADKSDDKDKKDDKVDEKPKYDKDGNRIEEDADKDADKDKKDEDDGEFTADDADSDKDEDEDKPAPADDKPAAPTEAGGVQMSDAERKYIVDNIGEPLVIRGMRGDKEVELKVFTPQQIPRDFKFASEADLLTAQNGFASLERRAEQLLGNFRQNASKEQVADFEKREDEGIKADVAELQAAGDFPKFKVKPGSAGFDDDPAAKLMTDVLKIMTDRNATYMEQYQQGRPYKHIGFAEAWDIYQRSQKKDDRQTAQDEEDKERKDISKRTGSENRGLVSDSLVKPRVRSGMTVDQILAAHENDF